VINIITKNSMSTLGNQITLLGGSQEGVATARHGSTIGDLGHYRIFAKGFARGQLSEEGRNIVIDPSRGDWKSGRFGFRMDVTNPDRSDNFGCQGEIFSSQFTTEADRILANPTRVIQEPKDSRARGGNILGKWEHRISDESETILKWFYDYYCKDVDLESGNVTAHTFDLDFQHRITPLNRHEVIWGLNGRIIFDEFKPSQILSADPESQTLELYSFFVQDQIQMIPKTLHMTLGSRFEYTDSTGWEIQPSLRCLYNVNDTHAFWAAISRASRIPSRIEQNGRSTALLMADPSSPSSDLVAIEQLGTGDLEAEGLTAWEMGYRYQPADKFWLDVATFYHDYTELIALRYVGEQPIALDSGYLYRYVFETDNNLNGQSWGFELAGYWQATSNWVLQGAYTFLETDIQQSLPDVGGEESILVRASHPRNQVSIRSSLDITPQFDMDLWLRYVAPLKDSDISEYASMDARLAWHPSDQIELSIVGQNLLEPQHAEFSSIEIERSFYVKLDWYF